MFKEFINKIWKKIFSEEESKEEENFDEIPKSAPLEIPESEGVEEIIDIISKEEPISKDDLKIRAAEELDMTEEEIEKLIIALFLNDRIEEKNKKIVLR